MFLLGVIISFFLTLSACRLQNREGHDRLPRLPRSQVCYRQDCTAQPGCLFNEGGCCAACDCLHWRRKGGEGARTDALDASTAMAWVGKVWLALKLRSTLRNQAQSCLEARGGGGGREGERAHGCSNSALPQGGTPRVSSFADTQR